MIRAPGKQKTQVVALHLEHGTGQGAGQSIRILTVGQLRVIGVDHFLSLCILQILTTRQVFERKRPFAKRISRGLPTFGITIRFEISKENIVTSDSAFILNSPLRLVQQHGRVVIAHHTRAALTQRRLTIVRANRVLQVSGQLHLSRLLRSIRQLP